MENKEKIFYDSMCNNCQEKFKKVITAAKKNPIKDLKDLKLFACYVDKERSIDNDNGLVPLAFIFCKKDSYVFFWKEDLYNGDGSPKIKIANDKLILSQTTIDRIKENKHKSNQLTVNNKEETYAIAQQLIKTNNLMMQRNFNQQMAILNRHDFHLLKFKKMLLGIVLALILILATIGSVLGWYFTSLANKNVNGQAPIINWRINLNEHLKNPELGEIDDNREETILNAAKLQNPDLVIKELLIENITQTSAIISVKSWSYRYDLNSFINVYYYAKLKTLKTDVTINNFSNLTNVPNDPQSLLTIVKRANLGLDTNDVTIENIKTANQIVSADLKVIEDNKVYVHNDQLKVYFSNTNKKLLWEVLTTTKLGDIKNNESTTILAKIEKLNPKLYVDEIGVDISSINSNQAKIKVNSNSRNYIISSETVTVDYRIFNPSIGTIKEKVEQPAGQSFDSSIRSLIQLKNETILAGTDAGSIYQLNSDGKIIKKVVDRKFDNKPVYSLVELSDGMILAGTEGQYNNIGGVIYQLNSDGSIKERLIKNIEDGAVNAIEELKDGTILIGVSVKSSVRSYGSIYQLRKSGQSFSVEKKVNKGIDGGINSMKQLNNEKVLIGTDFPYGSIYELDPNSFNKKLIVDQKFNNGRVSLLQLQDETVLAGVGGWSNYISAIYQLNNNGTIKEKILENDYFINISMIQLKNKTILLSSKTSIYHLNSQ
ncbi:hypothetical protein SSYRP_v1c06350 [Spiroplasma syrphidicola EA-1]|uniref:Uncharacterized protein n=1 Tax=Spiroplasma syrphidicola EA-1 TaxID=1276229 RepID=R4UJC2_9MOLU|nr:hypothetical protein [Spiroplasma syrphidicola]AGM26225.1 hypothetical protein SSYRP_v1c06350 [Spiroplasma syrphidicola EA-1]